MMGPRSLVDHLVVDGTTLVLLLAWFVLAGPLASVIAYADERSIINTLGSLGVFLGFLVYRRIWTLGRGS